MAARRSKAEPEKVLARVSTVRTKVVVEQVVLEKEKGALKEALESAVMEPERVSRAATHLESKAP
jgi:uncharacterized membrane protein